MAHVTRGKAERINRSFATLSRSFSQRQSRSLDPGVQDQLLGYHQVVGEVVDLASLYRSLSSGAVCSSRSTTTTRVTACVRFCRIIHLDHCTQGVYDQPRIFSSDPRSHASERSVCLNKCDTGVREWKIIMINSHDELFWCDQDGNIIRRYLGYFYCIYDYRFSYMSL